MLSPPEDAYLRPRLTRKGLSEGPVMTRWMLRSKQRVYPLLAVFTRRQWMLTMLCGALLAPPPALLGYQ